jgi:hypothetical protein
MKCRKNTAGTLKYLAPPHRDNPGPLKETGKSER